MEDSVKQDEEQKRENEEERSLEVGEPLPTEMLIPDRVRAIEDWTEHSLYVFSKRRWKRLPARVQAGLSFLLEFLQCATRWSCYWHHYWAWKSFT